MHAIGTILNTLAPVFLVVLLGALLRRSGFLTEAFASALNRFVFWVPLPVFLFRSIQASEFRSGSLPAAAVMMGATLAVAAISWFGASLFGISPRSRGSFCQSVFRSNNAYVGLPVILFAYAGSGAGKIDEIRALAALSLAPCLILYNVLAVLVLTPNAMGFFDGPAGAPKGRMHVPAGRILHGSATNPLILACVAGSVGLVLRKTTGATLPAFLDRSLESLGGMAGPGALVALGASLTPERLRASLRGAHFAAVLKLVACPLIGALLARVAGLDADARFVALAYLTCPTAVASFVMAQAMKGDDALAGSTVALTTLCSVAALAVLLLLVGPGAA